MSNKFLFVAFLFLCPAAHAGWNFTGTQASTVTKNGNGIFSLKNSWTILVHFKTPSNITSGSYRIIFSYDKLGHASPYYAAHLRWQSGGEGMLMGWNDAGTSPKAIQTNTSPILWTPTINTWYSVAAICDGAGKKQIWINGVLCISSTSNHTITYYDASVYIGASQFQPYTLAQDVDGVWFLNRAISESEAKTFTTSRKKFPCSSNDGCIMAVTMDEQTVGQRIGSFSNKTDIPMTGSAITGTLLQTGSTYVNYP